MKSINRFFLIVLLLLITPIAYGALENKTAVVANETISLLQAPGDPVVSITGPTSFCIGAANARVTFEAAGGTAPYTFTYRINGGPDQLATSTGTNSSVQVPVNTTGENSFTYRIIGIRGTSGKTIAVDVSTQITVTAAPAANFTFTGNDCSDTPVQFTSTVTSIGSYSYAWDFGDGESSTEQHPGHLFNALGCGTAS